MLDAGCWRLETGDWRLGAGCWTLETGAWSLEPGVWSLEANLLQYRTFTYAMQRHSYSGGWLEGLHFLD